jgi:GDP-L-fucose synthase
MLEGKNVLVAGGSGFVGANIINRLLSLGANVRATIHQKEPVIFDNRIDYIKCNLLKMDDCKKVVKNMDYVFMWAAYSSGAAVIKSNPVALVTPNVVMNTQMLEAAYSAKVEKFIFPSSSVVYPVSGEKPVTEDQMMDDDPCDIYFGPAWMKRFTEILCRLYSKKINNPMKTVVLRPANIYGPFDNFDLKTSHVMAATIRKVIERQSPIKVWGTGDDIRDFIYVDDFIDAIILAAEKINTYNPINIASGQGYSIKQILKILLDIENYKDAEVLYNPSKPSTIPIRLFSTAKAEAVLDFKAKTDIREGMTNTIEWYKKEYKA